MRTGFLAQVLATATALLFQISACAANPIGQTAQTIVAVVEPSAAGAQGQLPYSVLLDGAKLTNTLAILDGLAEPGNERLAPGSRQLAILIREDVPIGVVGTLVSMATKAGYSAESILVFVFDSKRRSMLKLSEYKSLPFSTEAATLAGHF